MNRIPEPPPDPEPGTPIAEAMARLATIRTSSHCFVCGEEIKRDGRRVTVRDGGREYEGEEVKR